MAVRVSITVAASNTAAAGVVGLFRRCYSCRSRIFLRPSSSPLRRLAFAFLFRSITGNEGPQIRQFGRVGMTVNQLAEALATTLCLQANLLAQLLVIGEHSAVQSVCTLEHCASHLLQFAHLIPAAGCSTFARRHSGGR